MLFTFINSLGVQFPIHGNYLLHTGWNLGEADTEIQAIEALGIDGKTYLGEKTGGRHIRLPFTIVSSTEQQLRDRIQLVKRVFDSRLGEGTLQIRHPNGNVYWIKCVKEGLIEVDGERRGETFAELILELFASKPDFYGLEKIEFPLAAFTGGWSFPWSFPKSFGVIGATKTIVVDGDLPTHIEIEITGPIQAPVFSNDTTGEVLTVVKELAENEKLYIGTDIDNLYVRFVDAEGNEEDSFDCVQPQADFWNLVPGENIIRYASLYEEAITSVMVSYYNKYSGV